MTTDAGAWLPAYPAIFASSFHPHVGGVEELVRQLAHHQIEAGSQPVVHTMRWPRSLPSREQWDGLEIRRHSFRTPEGSVRRVSTAALSNPFVLGAIVRQLRAARTDLVHVQCVSDGAWFAYQAARVLRIPCVVTLQGELTMDATDVYDRSALLRRTLRLLLGRADAVTACSRAALTEAQSWAGIDLGARGRVVHNGVDTREFAVPVSQRSHDRPFVLAIGRHVPQKGFDVLIDAFSSLVADRGFDGDLVIAGDGPDTHVLADLVVRLGLRDRVRLVGRTDRKTTVALFESAELFVLPSRHEPFGIVILEAMAAGTPVVASAVGGVPEFVDDGVNGLLVPPGDVEALAHAVRRVWSSRELSRSLAVNGRTQAAGFDWRHIEQQYREAYASARGLHRDAAQEPLMTAAIGAIGARLRIAITSLYLPGSSKIGVGFQVHYLANELVRRGHSVTVFSPSSAGEGAEYAVHHVDPGESIRSFRFAWRLREADLTRFDVLHAHGDDAFLAGRRRPPHVRTVHGSCFSEALRVSGFREMLRMGLLGTEELLSMAVADEVVAVSDATTRVYPWIRRVIPCGVAAATFGAQLGWTREPDPTILFVGTYRNRKRGWLLAEAFSRSVRPAFPEARLWMVCSDAPEGPGIEVFGRVCEAQLVELYQRAWLFCLPSSYEGFGVPYIEAMAAGCPVVATPNAGAREVLREGEFGRVVDAERLGDALVELVRDPAARADLASRGRARAKRYDWSRIAGEYETLYYSLV